MGVGNAPRSSRRSQKDESALRCVHESSSGPAGERTMSIQQTKCPEPGCGEATTAWAGGLQHETERNYERACPKHQEKYRKLRDEWRKQLDALLRYSR